MEVALAYLTNHAPNLGILVVACYTAWRVSSRIARGEARLENVEKGLAEHEDGCEKRAEKVDSKLDELKAGIAYIRGKVENL